MKNSFTAEDIQHNMERLKKLFPHLNKFPYTFSTIGKSRSIFDTIAEMYTKLAYPEHPNWSYCIPLVPNVEINGQIVDLGIHIGDDMLEMARISDFSILTAFSCNTVFSNEGPDYGSSQVSASILTSKRTMHAMHRLGMISDTDIMESICTHNGFMKEFMQSDMSMFDLHRLMKTAIKQEA